MIPRPPAIPASLAAIVLLGGLGLVYWSLTGLGLLKASDASNASSSASAVSSPPSTPSAKQGIIS
jgi:hypothetical protein